MKAANKFLLFVVLLMTNQLVYGQFQSYRHDGRDDKVSVGVNFCNACAGSTITRNTSRSLTTDVGIQRLHSKYLRTVMNLRVNIDRSLEELKQTQFNGNSPVTDYFQPSVQATWDTACRSNILRSFKIMTNLALHMKISHRLAMEANLDFSWNEGLVYHTLCNLYKISRRIPEELPTHICHNEVQISRPSTRARSAEWVYGALLYSREQLLTVGNLYIEFAHFGRYQQQLSRC